MTVDEALILIKKAEGDRRFNTIQEIVFRQSWQGQSYGEIARTYGYGEGYVKDTGYRLWSLLSEAFGEKVTKNNLHLVLKRYQQRQQNLARLEATAELCEGRENAVAPILHNLPVRHCTAFQERELEFSQLWEWLGDNRTYPWLGIEGVAGAGKTTLALELAYHCLEVAVPPVNAIAQTLNRIDFPPTDFEMLYESVNTRLHRQRTLLILDRWENFTEPERILAFLYDLPLTVKTIVTSRQSLLSAALPLSPPPNPQIFPFVKRRNDPAESCRNSSALNR